MSSIFLRVVNIAYVKKKNLSYIKDSASRMTRFGASAFSYSRSSRAFFAAHSRVYKSQDP